MPSPMLFVFPQGLLYWLASIWAYWPEMRIIRTGREAVRRSDSADGGSLKVIMFGGGVGFLLAFAAAWIPQFRYPAAWGFPSLVLGAVIVVAGGLLRRHCFRQLGESFTGDVRAQAGQQVVSTGAYRWLRHPSYTAGILMTVSMGLALNSWASTVVLLVVSFVVYGYRIAVEERALVAAIGEPYTAFMRTRRRLIPFVY